MLRRPAAPRPCAVVIGPDDLVQEALATEELVEQQLAVVRLARVGVEVEGAGLGKDAADLAEAWLEEPEVVVERVSVGRLAEERRPVAPSAEARAVALGVGLDRDRAPRLGAAGVEGWVGVDELERAVGKQRQDLEVVAEDDRAQGLAARDVTQSPPAA